MSERFSDELIEKIELHNVQDGDVMVFKVKTPEDILDVSEAIEYWNTFADDVVHHLSQTGIEFTVLVVDIGEVMDIEIKRKIKT